MKRFEILVSGEHEAEAGQEILAGIYAAVLKHGYTDISVRADTIRELGQGEVQVPSFLQAREKAPGRAVAARR